MSKYHVLKDQEVIATTATREQAIFVIRQHQEMEQKAHQWLWANFSIIYGDEEFVPYPQQKKTRKRRDTP